MISIKLQMLSNCYLILILAGAVAAMSRAALQWHFLNVHLLEFSLWVRVQQDSLDIQKNHEAYCIQTIRKGPQLREFKQCVQSHCSLLKETDFKARPCDCITPALSSSSLF